MEEFNKKELDKNVLAIKALVKKIGDLSKILFKQKKFFLYDESYYINHTFYTELNKTSNIRFNIDIANRLYKATNLIRPESSSKFRVVHNIHMDHIVLQLEDIRNKEK